MNNFNQGNLDDEVSVGSETLLPDMEKQQAAGTQADGSDDLTDPTSPNRAFTLPQMSTRMNQFSPQLPQQAVGNVEEAVHRNESLETENTEEDEDTDLSFESENTVQDEDNDLSFESENTEEDEEHDFGQGNNGNNEFIDEDPFMNPVIDGHVWQVTESSRISSFTNFHRFLEHELQTEYFKSKTAVTGESIQYVNENDVLLVGCRYNMSERASRMIDEASQAYSHHLSGTNATSKVMKMRLLLKMIDELRHSTDGILTCRLIKSDQTIVSMNGQLVNVIQYFELSMRDAMTAINDRLRRRNRQ